MNFWNTYFQFILHKNYKIAFFSRKIGMIFTGKFIEKFVKIMNFDFTQKSQVTKINKIAKTLISKFQNLKNLQLFFLKIPTKSWLKSWILILLENLLAAKINK